MTNNFRKEKKRKEKSHLGLVPSYTFDFWILLLVEEVRKISNYFFYSTLKKKFIEWRIRNFKNENIQATATNYNKEEEEDAFVFFSINLKKENLHKVLFSYE